VRRDFEDRAGGPGGAQLALALHLRDHLAEFGAFLRRQLLGVIGAGQLTQPSRLAVEAGVEQHRGRDHRSAERTAAGFVDARDTGAVGALLAVE
jgi:plasmid replication initiation protein